MKRTVEKLVTGELSIRAAANQYSLTMSALHRMWSKYKKMNDDGKINISFEKQHGFREIFNSEEEILEIISLKLHKCVMVQLLKTLVNLPIGLLLRTKKRYQIFGTQIKQLV